MQSQINEMAALDLGEESEPNVLNSSNVDKVWHYPILLPDRAFLIAC